MNTCVCVYIVMFFGSNSFLIHLSLKKTDKVLMLSFFYCIFHVCKQGIFFFICECRICLNSSFCVLLVNLLPIFKSKLSNTIIINGYKGSILMKTNSRWLNLHLSHQSRIWAYLHQNRYVPTLIKKYTHVEDKCDIPFQLQ